MKRVGITAGDIQGIGLEVTLKALVQHDWSSDVEFILYAPQECVNEQAAAFGLSLPTTVRFADSVQYDFVKWNPGSLDVAASVVANQAIRAAAADALDGKIDAIVTAPICKEGFHLAGIHVPGHTEYLAQLSGAKRVGMMLVGGGLRVLLATRHLPISQVAKQLTATAISDAIDFANEALLHLKISNGKIGVCGLNPHAGDGGVLGTEERDLILPVIEKAQEKGIPVIGPIPADTIFHKALNGEYDVVVAMYHDQGLGPLKMIGFDEGINITWGLPFIRTSPDHGTAFDIAGKNKASAVSMINAIRWTLCK